MMESGLDFVDDQMSICGSETAMLVARSNSRSPSVPSGMPGVPISARGQRSNSVKCGPSGPTAFDPEQPGESVPPKSPRPTPKSLAGDFPQSRTGSKKVYYML